MKITHFVLGRPNDAYIWWLEIQGADGDAYVLRQPRLPADAKPVLVRWSEYGWRFVSLDWLDESRRRTIRPTPEPISIAYNEVGGGVVGEYSGEPHERKTQ